MIAIRPTGKTLQKMRAIEQNFTNNDDQQIGKKMERIINNRDRTHPPSIFPQELLLVATYIKVVYIDE